MDPQCPPVAHNIGHKCAGLQVCPSIANDTGSYGSQSLWDLLRCNTCTSHEFGWKRVSAKIRISWVCCPVGVQIACRIFQPSMYLLPLTQSQGQAIYTLRCLYVFSGFLHLSVVDNHSIAISLVLLWSGKQFGALNSLSNPLHHLSPTTKKEIEFLWKKNARHPRPQKLWERRKDCG